MEYVTYILIIVGIMALCVILLRDGEQSPVRESQIRPSEKVSSKPPVKHSNGNGVSKAPIAEKVSVNGKRLDVPVPWGWPGHDEHGQVRSHSRPDAQEVHGVSESMHRFVDRILREKQTVDDREYLLRKDASLRALLEDRYGRASRLPQIKGKKPPKPSHDKSAGRISFEKIKEMKTPWGW